MNLASWAIAWFERQRARPKDTLFRDSRTDRVHLYMTIFEMPEKPTGMTHSILCRAEKFMKYGQPLSCTVLTFSQTLTVEESREQLVRFGNMDESVIVRGMWDELRRMDDAQLTQWFSGDRPEVISGTEPDGIAEIVSKKFTRYRDENQNVIGRRHYRDDGSILFTDFNEPSKPRRSVLHSTDSEPIVEWKKIRSLYNRWLEFVIDRSPAVLVLDSGAVAGFAHEIEPRNFRTVHFMHVSHLAAPGEGSFGDLAPGRAAAVRDHEQFDYVAVQSKQQAEDLAKLGLATDNMFIVPSDIPDTAIRPAVSPGRGELKGISAARLVDVKQIDHVIDAVSVVSKTNPSIELDVFGVGPLADELQSRIETLGLHDVVKLRGYATDMPDRFAAGSFSVLASSNEGLALAVVESMAAGCIPIAYDVKYGPGEIITQGVNGYVVPEGNVNALASQIAEFIALPGAVKSVMRQAAVERARDYLSAQGYSRWKKMLESAISASSRELPVDERGQLQVHELAIAPTGDETHVSAAIETQGDGLYDRIVLLVVSRRGRRFFQATGVRESTHPLNNGAHFYQFVLAGELFSQSDGETFDVFIRHVGARWKSKSRIRLPAEFRTIKDNGLRWYRTERGNLSVECRLSPKCA